MAQDSCGPLGSVVEIEVFASGSHVSCIVLSVSCGLPRAQSPWGDGKGGLSVYLCAECQFLYKLIELKKNRLRLAHVTLKHL